jgi:hypothetical protein
MTEFKVEWHLRGRKLGSPVRVLFVEAIDAAAAKAVAVDHIQRTQAIGGGFVVAGVEPYTRPSGRVVSGV